MAEIGKAFATTVSGAEIGTDKGTKLKQTFKAGDATPFNYFGVPSASGQYTTLNQPMTADQADLLNRMINNGATLTKYNGSGGNYSLDLPPNWVDGVNNVNEVNALSAANSTDGGPSTGTVGALIMNGGRITPDRQVSVGMNSGVGYGDVEIDAARKALAKFNGGFKAGDPKEYASGAYATDMVMTQADADAMNKKYASYIEAGKTGSTTTTATTGSRPYAAGDPNPQTGIALTATQADNLNKQGATYNPTTKTSSVTQAAEVGPAANGTPANTTGTSNNTTTTSTTGTVNSEDNAAALKILNDNFNSGAIDFGTYNFFKQAIQNWDPSSEVNYANILSTFNDIAANTVDPYFQEQAKMYIDDTQLSIKALNAEKALSDTALSEELKSNTETAQKNLNESGMMFTGEGIKQLGANSTYAQPGTTTQSAIPLQQANFGGGYEVGAINQANQTAVSTANLRYKQQLEELARNAEKTLGSSDYESLNTGVSALGGITGSLQEQKQSAKASALTDTYNQEINNYNAKKSVDIIS